MRELIINPSLVKNTKFLEFKEVPSMYKGFFDVLYNNQRIAIINGVSSALQWTAKNGSNIPLYIIQELENEVNRLIDLSNSTNRA